MGAELSDRELAALYGVSDGRFELDNLGAERMVRRRYWLVTVSLALGTLAVGEIALSKLIVGHPITNWSLFLVVTTVIGVGIGLPMGYGMGRSMTGLFVPKAVTLQRDGVLVDLRREGWPPPRIHKMKFEDVRGVRLSPFFRVPYVTGVVTDPGIEPHSYSFYYYLDPITFEMVKRAYMGWKESTAGDGQGKVFPIP